MSAYIDPIPVRAGMVADPVAYHWSSYGEAAGGGNKGNGKEGAGRSLPMGEIRRTEATPEGRVSKSVCFAALAT